MKKYVIYALWADGKLMEEVERCNSRSRCHSRVIQLIREAGAGPTVTYGYTTEEMFERNKTVVEVISG